MELKNKKSAWAALATIGVTAIAAGATAIVKFREKQRLAREAEEKETPHRKLTADQEMVYNEAVRAFLLLNDRIYELRSMRKDLQPLIHWLVTDGDKPIVKTDDERIIELIEDIRKFLVTQVPFINACISTINDDGMTYSDYLRAATGQPFDSTLDVEQAGAEVEEGSTIKYVLKIGYYFPDSRIATHPVKSIVLV